MVTIDKTQENMDKYGVAWFKFDEASGNVLDSKGSAIGTITGSTRVTGWDGQGYALNFDGNDYVKFNGHVIPHGKKSIRFLIKNPKQNKAQTIFANAFNGALIKNGLLCAISDTGRLVLYSYNNSDSPTATIISNKNIDDNHWHDILIKFSGTGNLLNVDIFIDDMKINDVQGQINEGVGNYPLFLGKADVVNYESYLNGQIDNLEIFNDLIDLSINKILIKQNDTSYVYYGQNPTTLENEWISIGTSPTDEDWLNKGVDVVTQAQLEKLSQQAITGRFAVKRL